MKQLKVSLDDDLRDYIEVASEKAGRSISEEIRERLLATVAHDHTDRPTRWLMLSVQGLAAKVKTDTGQDWHSHPAANRVLKLATGHLLDRLRPKDKEAVFAPDELPAARLVNSTEPEGIALGLEAIEFYGRPLSAEDQQTLTERDREFERVREQSAQGLGAVSSLFQKSDKGGEQ